MDAIFGPQPHGDVAKDPLPTKMPLLKEEGNSSDERYLAVISLLIIW